MKLGLLSDIHGDFTGMVKALAILDQAAVDGIICAGDVADRGPDADLAVEELLRRDIPCVLGNHDITIAKFENRVRNPKRIEELKRLGRIVKPETSDYLRHLPPHRVLTYDSHTVLVAHGAPWSDVVSIFPDARMSMLERLDTYASKAEADTLILGHTHQPMHIKTPAGVDVVNPGSIYNVTIRDSGTCAIYDLTAQQLAVYDLETGEPTANN